MTVLVSYTPAFDVNNFLNDDGDVPSTISQGDVYITSQNWWSQSFTVSGDDYFPLDGSINIAWKFVNDIPPTGTPNSRRPLGAIYAADGSGVPTGSPITLVNFRATEELYNPGGNNSQVWTYSANSISPGFVRLSSGNIYALVIYDIYPEYRNSYSPIGEGDVGTYSDGATYYTTDYGNSWVASAANFYLTFEGRTTTPDPPVNVQPLDLATNVRSDIVITWEDANKYTWSYDVYVDISGIFPIGTTKVVDDTYQLSYAPVGLVSGNTVLVRIVAKNSYEDSSNYDFQFDVGIDTPISNQAGWDAMRSSPNGSYYLTQDITLTGSYTTVGNVGDGTFTGIIDGQGYTVDMSGVTFNPVPTVGGTDAPFCDATNATFLNLTIEGITIPDRTSYAPPAVIFYGGGGFIGWPINCTFYNCHTVSPRISQAAVSGGFASWAFTGTSFTLCSASDVVMESSSDDIGGFVGFSQSAAGFFACYAEGSITQSNEPWTQPIVKSYGGFAGNTFDSTMTDCYAKVTMSFVDTYEKTGGFFGESAGNNNVLRCYCTEQPPSVTDPENNPFAGDPSFSDTFTDCYFQQGLLTETDPNSSPLNSAEIKQSSSFEGTWPANSFSNSDTWKITNALTTPLFDNMPSAPILIYPANGASDVPLTPLILQWTNSSPYPASSYDVYFGETQGAMTAIATGLSVNKYDVTSLVANNTDYYWRVDALGQFDTTQSETWVFNTGTFSPPIPGGSGGGTVGTGFDINAMKTYRRLVCIVNNEVWYEDI